ncbi:jg13455 [Pararge aegeria aegeria]|uniref:Jg13455 protein n=1 Tax=Pararge aegeria aegeria TaxID=348720 RepID=A0A8S4RV96_9NEOP|nr:jg13455 [Pararge aegeria aegeria]
MVKQNRDSFTLLCIVISSLGVMRELMKVGSICDLKLKLYIWEGTGLAVLIRLLLSTPLLAAVPLLPETGSFGCWVTPPGPMRPSLVNLDLSESSERSILIPGLVWTSSQHRPLISRFPYLKPSTSSDLYVARLQETPRSRSNAVTKILYWTF